MTAHMLVVMVLGFLGCFLGAFSGAAAATVWMHSGCPLPSLPKFPSVVRVERIDEATRLRLNREKQAGAR